MQISGFIALFAAIIVSRIINEKAYKSLGDEDKLRLMDGFSKSRAYSMIPLFCLIGLYWFFMTKTDFDRGYITIGYFIILILYVVVRVILNLRKLKELKLPETYRRLFTTGQVVSLVGVAWFFYTAFQIH